MFACLAAFVQAANVGQAFACLAAYVKAIGEEGSGSYWQSYTSFAADRSQPAWQLSMASVLTSLPETRKASRRASLTDSCLLPGQFSPFH